MYYVVYSEENHDSKAKSPSPGCSCFDTRYFSGRDSIIIKPKEIIALKQLA